MAKIRMTADSPEKGNIRHDMFADVIQRYNEAMTQGYYLEALTLMESIISDRLESILSHLKGIDSPFMTLGSLINNLHKHIDELPNDLPPLLADIDQWRKDRNQALHEMAKIDSANITESFKTKYQAAQNCAKDGLGLFRNLDKIISNQKHG